MGERLTKEREEEIRARLEIGRLPVLGTALDVVAELLAELDALRAAPPTTYLRADGTEEPIGELVARLTRERDTMGASLRDEVTARLDAEDRAEKAEARVRELEAERAGLVTAEAYGQATAALAEDLAETRAQLARLRDVIAKTEADIALMYMYPGWRPVIDALRAALSTTGPTLAEMRAEALRDAARRWMADHENSTSAEHVHDWLRRRADDLEAGRA